jgi:chromate reductase
MQNKIKIIGLVGSLRQDSFNKALMQAAVEMCPAGAEIEITDINFPLFNQDLENDLPESVKIFKEKIKLADVILFATPEYNYSFSGVLKNAIDWGSRPLENNSFNGKPAAIMSASIGMIGGARAQYHLRQSFVYLNIFPLNQPEVMVPFAQEKIQDGKVIDEKTREKIKELVEALVEETEKCKL